MDFKMQSGLVKF